MNKRSLLIILILFTGLTTAVFSQNGKITGKVLDASNGGVLPDAVIKIEGINKGTATDLDGSYTFENIAAGELSVKVSYVGYVTQSTSIKMQPGEVISLDFVLQPEGALIDTVTI